METSDLKQYQQEIIFRLIGKYKQLNSIDLQEEVSGFPMKCRKCGHDHFVKNGHFNEQQRYMCKKCRATQFPDANTALYNLKLKDKWVDFVAIMLEKDHATSCIAISKELHINEKTAHQWRLKMLSCLNEHQGIQIGCELELDEVYFPFCVKGRIGKEKFDTYIKEHHPDNVESDLRLKEKKMEQDKHQAVCIIKHNRNKDFSFETIKILKKGNVSKSDLARVLKDTDFTGKTVITDSGRPLIAYFKKQQNVIHQTFKSEDVKQGRIIKKNIHNNNINNTMSHLREWLKKFKGVSTKYLGNYLKWFRLKNIFNVDNAKSFLLDYVSDRSLYSRFLDIFKIYKQFVFF